MSSNCCIEYCSILMATTVLTPFTHTLELLKHIAVEVTRQVRREPFSMCSLGASASGYGMRFTYVHGCRDASQRMRKYVSHMPHPLAEFHYCSCHSSRSLATARSTVNSPLAAACKMALAAGFLPRLSSTALHKASRSRSRISCRH